MKQFIICPKCGAIILSDCNYDPIPCECGEIDEAGLWKPAKAISIKQPWAYLICSGIKDIENRTWKTNFRGRALIHAGKKYDFGSFAKFRESESMLESYERTIGTVDFDMSAIIGSVEIVDCVESHQSVWAEKGGYTIDRNNIFNHSKIYNWVLKDPILFEKPILNVKGKLSFFIPGIN